jgi:hypothetical protein
MGEVWRAEDTRLGRVVAIKVLPPSLFADVEATARLKREARAAAQLYHPSIATIHSIEQDGDHIFIVEEFVDGESLTNVIKRGGLSEAEICRIGRAVADALAEAHAKGIVHRDIKPDNIIVAGNRVKVLDFGIAKQVGVVGAAAADTPTAAFMTQQGMILGTIHYMSPEQALGKTIDGRTDVFSLGVVLYEMATGRRPFAGDTITETMTQIIRDEPAEPLAVNPGISPEMNQIIQRSLRKNTADRFTAAELVTALDAHLGRAKTSPYTSPHAITAPAVAAAAAPTVITGSQAKTVHEAPAKPRRSSAVPVIIGVMVIALAAAAAVIATHRSTPVQTPKPQPVAPAATSSVNVTAPSGTVVETTTTAPAPDEEATTTTETDTASSEKTAPAVGSVRTEPAPATDTEDAGPASAGNADALYATAMSQLTGGDGQQARKTLHRVLRQDPHYAKAHFRLGQIALFNRNFNPASEELNLALGDADRLDAREQQLARISLAIASHDRQETQRIAREIWQRWPGDPDLVRIREFFPGMFPDAARERFHRRQRP